jgi:hypothetical protein
MMVLMETYFLIVGTAIFGVTEVPEFLSISGQLLLAHFAFTSANEEATGFTRHFLDVFDQICCNSSSASSRDLRSANGVLDALVLISSYEQQEEKSIFSSLMAIFIFSLGEDASELLDEAELRFEQRVLVSSKLLPCESNEFLAFLKSVELLYSTYCMS